VPPCKHAEGERQSVALLHRDHLLFGGLRQDDAAGSLSYGSKIKTSKAC
jgi:hypothetical protein